MTMDFHFVYNRYLLAWSFMLLSFLCRECLSSGKIAISLIQYENEDGKGANGNCCEGTRFFCFGRCDHYFIICLDDLDGDDTTDSCSLGKYTTDATKDRNSIRFGARIGKSTPNPKYLSFPTWQGGMKIKIDVWDEDGGTRHDKVDSLRGSVNITEAAPSATASHYQRLQIRERTSLDLKVKVFCDPFFYGPTCDTECRPTSGARGNYNCEPETGFRLCHTGWTGESCDVDIDDCAESPCKEPGGVCMDKLNGYECICNPGYIGNHCEVEINECDSMPCANNGTCTDQVNGFTCQCRTGFQGSQCEIDINECETYGPNPCSDHGECFDDIGEFTCNCLDGFTGERCEEEIDECSSSPCPKNSTCSDLVGDFECLCPKGSTGKKCEIDIDDCLSSPCAEGSTCQDNLASYTCLCQTGYNGTHCDNLIHYCNPSPCQNGATCTEFLGGYNCTCIEGFTGQNCHIDIDDCEGDPCLKNQVCTDLVGRYDCSCKPGYTDQNCTTDIDDCMGIMCQNGGTCIDGVASYRCQCINDFVGLHCTVPTTICSTVPCQNNGTCMVHQEGFICTCPPGYLGDTCEIKYDPCDDLTCENGGTCIKHEFNATCACTEDFKGLYCEEHSDPCWNTTCMNNGTCAYTNLGVTCLCVYGYSGDSCQILDVPPEPQPIETECSLGTLTCEGGHCIDGHDGTSSCLCNHGYNNSYDNRACIDIDECGYDVCGDVMVCMNHPGGYRCICPPGYYVLHQDLTHPLCIDYNECAHDKSLCEGGTCVNTDGSYRCRCPHGTVLTLDNECIDINLYPSSGLVSFKGVLSQSDIAGLEKLIREAVKEVTGDIFIISNVYYDAQHCYSTIDRTPVTNFVFAISIKSHQGIVKETVPQVLELLEMPKYKKRLPLPVLEEDLCNIGASLVAASSFQTGESRETRWINMTWIYIVIALCLLTIIIIIIVIIVRRKRKQKMEDKYEPSGKTGRERFKSSGSEADGILDTSQSTSNSLDNQPFDLETQPNNPTLANGNVPPNTDDTSQCFQNLLYADDLSNKRY